MPDTVIDSAGELPDGTKINGPDDLRNALLRRPEQFVQTFVENLLTYSMGRTREYYDMPTVRRIVRDTRGQGLQVFGHRSGGGQDRPVQDAPRAAAAAGAGTECKQVSCEQIVRRRHVHIQEAHSTPHSLEGSRSHASPCRSWTP